MAKKNEQKLTAEDLRVRFQCDTVETVYVWAKRYREILQPMKIGRKLLFNIENVKKFEEHMKVKS